MRNPRIKTLIEELIGLLQTHGIHEVEVETSWLGKTRVRVARGVEMRAPEPTTAVPSRPQPLPSPPEADETLHTIRSPMVGKFYRAPSPDTPPYASEGDSVSAGQVVCIIEAMKIMNEIESEVKGRVVRVLAENAQPVEYHQPLFLIEPA